MGWYDVLRYSVLHSSISLILSSFASINIIIVVSLKLTMAYKFNSGYLCSICRLLFL